MKKRGKKQLKKVKVLKSNFIKSEVKELVKDQENILFSLFFWDIKKRHFYSFSSLIFSIIIGLAIINNIRSAGKYIALNFVITTFIVSLIILFVIVSKNLTKQKKKPSFISIINMLFIIYLTNLLFAMIFFVLYFFAYSNLLLVKEILFILGLSSLFSTISLHIH